MPPLDFTEANDIVKGFLTLCLLTLRLISKGAIVEAKGVANVVVVEPAK